MVAVHRITKVRETALACHGGACWEFFHDAGGGMSASLAHAPKVGSYHVRYNDGTYQFLDTLNL